MGEGREEGGREERGVSHAYDGDAVDAESQCDTDVLLKKKCEVRLLEWKWRGGNGRG